MNTFSLQSKKVEPTHGTPPATGISSFRSTTTNDNIHHNDKNVNGISTVA